MADAARPPVLILGMHRSGTSMLTRMLEELGVFLGWRKQGDHEATFFLGLDDWLLEQCRAGWDNPRPIENLLNDAELRGLALDYLRLSCASPRRVSYLGPRRALERLPLGGAWGWKDPRTTFTLPLWRELFPGSRIIEVRRHGVDVAQSLLVRHRRIVAHRVQRYARMRPLYRWRARRSRLTTSARCATLEGGFSLWEEYCLEAERQFGAHDGETLRVRYEDFLASPREGLRQLAGFCGVEADQAALDRAASQAREANACAYLRHDALRAFATANERRLQRFGYSGFGVAAEPEPSHGGSARASSNA